MGVELSLAGSGLSLDFSAGTLFLLADASELIGGDADGAPSWSVVGSWSIDGSSVSISSPSEAAKEKVAMVFTSRAAAESYRGVFSSGYFCFLAIVSSFSLH